jgi:hypothetical protein
LVPPCLIWYSQRTILANRSMREGIFKERIFVFFLYPFFAFFRKKERRMHVACENKGRNAREGKRQVSFFLSFYSLPIYEMDVHIDTG